MTTTQVRPDQTHAPEAAPPKPDLVNQTRERLVRAATRQISTRRAFGTTIAWIVLFTFAVGTVPAPANPNAAEPIIGILLSVVLLASFYATIAGLAVRRRWGLMASAVASGTLLVMTLACPITGHHALGMWWFGQLACASALCGITRAGLRNA